MNEKRLSPKEYEDSYLPKLNKEYNEAVAWLQSNRMEIKKNFTSQYIMAIINQLERYEKHFLTYEPLAEYLNKASLSQMSNSLTKILTDIRNALYHYRQIYQSALNNERQLRFW